MNDIGNKEVMGRNIDRLMKAAGKTRREVCKDLHLSYSTFTEWVNGKKYPRIDKIELMANYFGVQKSDLIEAENKEEPATDNGSGLSESQRELMRFAEGLSEEEAAQVLQTMKLLVQGLRK